MIYSLHIRNSTLYINKKFDTELHDLKDYYYFLVNKLKKILNEKDYNLIINFTGTIMDCDLNLWFQYEHTIKKINGELKPMFHNYDNLQKMDFIFDYTNTNIEHAKKFGYDTSNIIYIPPINTESFIFNKVKNRKKLVTTFHTQSTRRTKFLNLGYDNVYGIYNFDDVLNVLGNYKILLNIHQIDDHLSCEELRITPNIFSGILIVSEYSPYFESLPHSKHIIWCDYNNIEKTVADIDKNYEFYKDSFLNGLENTFNQMQSYIDDKIKNILNI